MKKLLALGFLIPLALSTALPGRADEARIQASLDHNVMDLKDSAILQVSITGSGEVCEPRLPPLPQFTLETAGRSEETTIENGNLSSKVIFQYVIRPAKIGSFSIGPISAQVDGQNVSSQPLQIKVTGNSPGLGGPVPAAAFVSAEVDNKSPYLGQTVTYRLRFYHSPGVALSGQAELPSTTGFINQPRTPEKTYTTTIQGRSYQVDEIAMGLCPTTAGEVEIGPARLRCSLPMNVQGLMDDEFLGLLSRSNLKELSTQPIALHVRPTPAEGRPDDFSGGVGKFTLEGSLEPGQARVGQPLNLELTVRGEGNLELVQAPPVPPMADFKVLDSRATGPQQPGMRKFSLALIPTRAGRLEIPAITMSTFDPNSQGYERLTTRPMAVAVAADPVPDGGNPPPAKPESAPVRRPPFRILPLMLLGAAWFMWRRRPRQSPKPSPLKQALRQLGTDPGVAGIPPILYGYLSEKLEKPAGSMSTPQMAQDLVSRGASAAQVDQLVSLLSEAERARYSPGHQAQGTVTCGDVARLLRELDRSLK